MQGCIPRSRFGLLWIACLACSFSVQAGEVPSTWIDDAQLNDVQFIGSKFAIAVGEHGAIWRSEDSGRQWARLNCGLDVSLRSVCFLTDQIGWVAGGDSKAYSGLDEGVLLATGDGGRKWQRLGRESLSALSYVKFFGPDEGVVVGQPTPLSPSGIYKTEDEGHTWVGIQGETPQAWKASCFLDPEMGLVAGANGRVSLMGGEQVIQSQLVPQGVRSIRSIAVNRGQAGWIAGDGGLVLKSDNGGVVWEAPPTALPEELRTGMDFRAAEVRGGHVWLAGSPGSVIWHSADGGKSWSKRATGQTAPLNAIRFTNDQQGLAVGALGVIIRTEDGGKTWKAARGDGRRAALLALHARPSQTSAPLLTKLSGEQGYRSAVWVAQRNDLGPLATAKDGESRLHAAVQKAGGNASDLHWQFPLAVPGLEHSSEKLLAEWQRQTEGKLPQTLLGGLTRQIRTWRPNVVVIDQPSPDDAACQLLFDAALRAVEQSADATRYVEQSEMLGLAPWTVDRVYVRLATGAAGDAMIDLDEFLPHLKSSTRLAASASMTLLQPGRVPVLENLDSSRISYRWLGLDGKVAAGSGGGRARDFFGGLSIPTGSAARRDAIAINEDNLERMQKLIQKQRNITAIGQKNFDDPRKAGQMIAQIDGIIEGMDPSQAAIVLHDMADEYRKRSQYELVEATYAELVRRCPNEPASLDAMRWLIQFWCSSETAWQRSRAMREGTMISQSELKQHTQYVQQALGETAPGDGGVVGAGGTREGGEVVTGVNATSPARLTAKFDFESAPPKNGNKRQLNPGRMKFSRESDVQTGAVSEWQTRAMELAKKLEVTSPGLFRSPDVQFPLAALRRTKGTGRAADAIMRTFVSSPLDAETKELAERELWISLPTVETPAALAYCRPVDARPHLDGVLSEHCWEDAKEIQLTSRTGNGQASGNTAEVRPTMAMFAYDQQFLYVALSVPRAEGVSTDGVQNKGRQHDADLSRHDRVSIRLDIDRDYATWYDFQIDQRGWTAESCWEDRRWNPKWFVAAEGEQSDWRVELAIPWNELVPVPPQRGSIYGVSVLRTIPTVGLQTWTHPATVQPQPASFGLLKFE